MYKFRRDDPNYIQQKEVIETDIAKSRKSKMKKTPDDTEHLKMEIAAELGLLDKVKAVGWAGLSAKETGRMGGMVTKRKREMNNKKSEV